MGDHTNVFMQLLLRIRPSELKYVSGEPVGQFVCGRVGEEFFVARNAPNLGDANGIGGEWPGSDGGKRSPISAERIAEPPPRCLGNGRVQYAMSNPIDTHVGQRLRALRLEKGLTQEELGALVEVSYQQIQKYETGTNRISASRLYLLSQQLGVGPAFFFEELKDGIATSAPRLLKLDAANGRNARRV